MFEDFYCPKCKKNTTLFLPTVKIEKPKEEPVIQEAAKTQVVLEPVVTSRGLFNLKDGIIFIIGFISALLIMKTWHDILV